MRIFCLILLALLMSATSGSALEDALAKLDVNSVGYYELWYQNQSGPNSWKRYSEMPTLEEAQYRAVDLNKLGWAGEVRGPFFRPAKPGSLQLIIERGRTEKGLVYGHLYANGQLLGDVAENDEKKIPSGNYPGVLRTTSGKNFVQNPGGILNAKGDFLLEIAQVPQRSDILIHPGNKAEHSLGCVLAGPVTRTADNKPVAPLTLRKLRYFFYGTDTPNSTPDRKVQIEVRTRNGELIDMVKLRKQLEIHEGKKDTAYLDSEKIPTIGIGFNLNKSGAKKRIEDLGLNYDDVVAGKVKLTDDQIEKLFAPDVASAISTARATVKNFDKLSEIRKRVLADMAFNLGPTRLSGFKKMIAAIEADDFATAADEMKNSKWYTQVGTRGVHLEQMMRGTLDFPK